jgi:hypothetical protein
MFANTSFFVIGIRIRKTKFSISNSNYFSKMKLIKTSARNSMSNNRLSDLSLLAIERDFPVDYERIIDVFAIQHKNSRIMLK